MKTKWISVDDSLPKTHTESGYSDSVLIYNGRSYSVGWYHSAGFWWTENEAFHVIHWAKFDKVE